LISALAIIAQRQCVCFVSKRSIILFVLSRLRNKAFIIVSFVVVLLFVGELL
jgi:hypothetical protein